MNRILAFTLLVILSPESIRGGWREEIVSTDCGIRAAVIKALNDGGVSITDEDRRYLVDQAKESSHPEDTRADCLVALRFSVFHGYDKEHESLRRDLANELVGLAINRDESIPVVRQRCIECLEVCFDGTPEGNRLEEQIIGILDEAPSSEIVRAVALSVSLCRLKPLRTNRVGLINGLKSESRNENEKVNDIKMASNMVLTGVVSEDDWQEIIKTAYIYNTESDSVCITVFRETNRLVFNEHVKCPIWLVLFAEDDFCNRAISDARRLWAGFIVAEHETRRKDVVEVAVARLMDKKESIGVRKVCLRIVKGCFFDDETLIELLSGGRPVELKERPLMENEDKR